MAYERNPNDPYQRDLADNDARRAARVDNELQPDLELAEGPASGGRIAVFAVAVAVILGVVFYGLNNSSTETSTASQTPTQSTAQNNAAKPPVAPGVRDVTPNAQPGVTTGAAPARPAQPAPAPAAPAPAPATPAPAK
jgi:type IV secretory pathway VirB10-like protein